MTSDTMAPQIKQSPQSTLSGMLRSVVDLISKSYPKNVVFVIACSLIGAAILFAIPSYYPLLQPDSFGYLSFDRSRTALYPLFLQALTGVGLKSGSSYLRPGNHLSYSFTISIIGNTAGRVRAVSSLHIRTRTRAERCVLIPALVNFN